MKIEINNSKLISRYGSLLRKSGEKKIADLNNHQLQAFDIQINRIEHLVKEFNGVMYPNRMNHNVIALITAGSGIKKVGYHQFEISKNTLFVIPKNIIHSSIAWSLATKGYMVTFDERIFSQFNLPISFMGMNNLFKLSQTPFARIEANKVKLIKYCFNKLLAFNKGEYSFSDEILLLTLAQLIFYFKSELETEKIEDIKTSHLFDKFIELVEKHFQSESGVKFYSDKLGTHQNHLNKIVKQNIGTTAKKYISGRIIQEAEYLLRATNYSIKEIAFQLGFTDTNHFSKSVKITLGKTPTEIRSGKI